jgi:hypothetical protein
MLEIIHSTSPIGNGCGWEFSIGLKSDSIGWDGWAVGIELKGFGREVFFGIGNHGR